MSKAEAKTFHVEMNPEAGTRVIDLGPEFAALRVENEKLRGSERAHALNRQIEKKNAEHAQREILRLQSELLTSQDKVRALQDQLLSLREIVNRPLPKE